MKKLVYLITAVFCIIFSCAFVEEQKVYDNAGILTQEQVQALQSECLRIANEKKVDVIILTISDAEGKTSEEYADDFYDNNKFGYEAENGTGILLLVDMDNRNAQISTSGDAIKYFTDTRIELVLDSIFEFLGNKDYYNSCNAFLTEVENYMGKEIEKSTISGESNYYVDEKSTPIEKFQENFLIYFIISILAGVVGVLILVFDADGKTVINNVTYLNKSSVKINKSYEQFLRTTITQRKIERNDNNGGSSGGSSTHTSSGGETHGGGGRSF